MTRDLAVITARIEALIAELDASRDTDARRCASELLRETMALYEAGLVRMLDIVREQDAAALMERFSADPAVATMLALHDLAPRAGPVQPLVQIARNPRREHSVDTTCERCGASARVEHRHLVHLEERRLLCCCEPCWQLASAADDTELRAVPAESGAFPALAMTEAHWNALEIPVGLAFFIVNSRAGRTFAFYPSPAGAVESLLSLEAWHALQYANPWLSRVAPDVEAVLVRKARDAEGEYQSVVLPVDRCYDLIGRIRLHWKGFDGGDAVRRDIERHFTPHAPADHGTVLAVAQ